MMASASRTSGLDIPFVEADPVSVEAARAKQASLPNDAPLEPGAMIAERYRVVRKIGEGGMGVLYACTDTVLARTVAVKLMQRSLAADPQLSERLLREARLAAQLRRHVAQVFDCGTLLTGEPYIVMELLTGRDMYTVLRDSGPLSPSALCSTIQQVCVGLAEAHEKGIIHRDLKPENLFCAREPDGSTVVKIVDFGVSKQLTSRMRTMTNPTESVGSPQYMSPEQISTPAQVDPRTDIWSLGVVMFELLTGALPFNGPGPAQICAAVLSQPVPPLSDYRKDVPPALEFILLRCLEKDRTRRFASVTDLAEALSGFAAIGELPAAFYEVTEDDQLSRPRRRGLGALFGLVVLAACGAVLAMGVRDGRIQVPGREAILQQVPSELRALRSTFDRALRRAPALPVHRDE